jgi:hypothetical protein
MAVRDVRFDITADNRTKAAFASVQRSLSGIRADARATSESVLRISEAGRALGKGFLFAAGAGAIFAGLEEIPRMAREAIDRVADIGKVADKLGISNEFLQKLQLIGKEADISSDSLNAGLEHFNKNVGLAKQGFGELAPILKANHVALTDAAGQQRPLNDLIRDYANLIKNAKSAQDQEVLGARAFGRELGDELLPALKGGADAIDRFDEAAARKHGGFISDEDIAKARELRDAFIQLSDRLDVTFERLAVRAGGLIEQAGELQHNILDPKLVEPNTIDDTKKEIEALKKAIAAAQEQIAQGFYPADAVNADIQHLADLEARVRKAATLFHQNLANEAARAGGRIAGAFGEASGVQQFGSVDALKKSGRGTTVLPPKPGRAGPNKEEQFEKEIDAIHKRTAALAAETATLGQGIAIQQTARIEAELFTSAQDKGLISATRFKNVQDLIAASTASLTSAERKLRGEIVGSAEDYGKAAAAAADAKQAQDLLFESEREFADQGETAIESLIVDHEKLGDVLRDTIKWLEKATIKAALLGQGPLASLFGNAQPASAAGSGIGGFFGNLLHLFGGARATGGPVRPGRAYLVGERGPELFAPQAPGRIVPAGGWGGGKMNISINLAGANGDQAIAFAAREAAMQGAQMAIAQVRRAGSAWAAEDQARYA